MGRYKRHKAKWSKCEQCSLCENRNRVVMARGKIPCDVLFIGEAPSQSDDVTGVPFKGPAGKYLDQLIKDSIGEDVRCAFTHLVACLPKDERGTKYAKPDKKQIQACNDRLQEFIAIAKPKLIVGVGALVAKHLPPFGSIVNISHPAVIMGADASQKPIMIHRCIITLQEAIEETL